MTMDRERMRRRPGVRNRIDWYKISNKAPGNAEVMIYDEIGYWGITAQDLVNDLKALDATSIDVRLNSPGGEVFDGIAIYNALVNHPATINIHIDGLAASAASFIAMAGDTITMAATATMMIHDGIGFAVGNAADMRETADLLDKISDNIASIYAARAGGDAGMWRDKMRTETWYTAAEAKAAGLADVVTPRKGEESDDTATTNRWDVSLFQARTGDTEAPADPPRRPDPPSAPVPAAPVAQNTDQNTDPATPADVAPPATDDLSWLADTFRQAMNDLAADKEGAVA